LPPAGFALLLAEALLLVNLLLEAKSLRDSLFFVALGADVLICGRRVSRFARRVDAVTVVKFQRDQQIPRWSTAAKAFYTKTA